MNQRKHSSERDILIMLIIIMLIIIIIIIIVIMLLCMVKRLGYIPYTYHRGHV